MRVGGASRVFALLGDPVSHSLSPIMYNATFAALGIDAVYVPLRCGSDAVETLMRTLASQGGGGNVTIPHKTTAAEVLSRLGGYDAGVCNTFWGQVDGLFGTETDSAGILASLSRLDATAGAWCLIGTGGSARSALRAARQAGARVAVQSRTPERAKALADAATALGVPLAEVGECHVAINCSPLGLVDGDPLPLPPAALPAVRVALDLVYRRGETAWVRAMRHAGCRAADGREMLVEQGALAFEQWFPRLRAPREIMRAAVGAALG